MRLAAGASAGAGLELELELALEDARVRFAGAGVGSASAHASNTAAHSSSESTTFVAFAGRVRMVVPPRVQYVVVRGNLFGHFFLCFGGAIHLGVFAVLRRQILLRGPCAVKFSVNGAWAFMSSASVSLSASASWPLAARAASVAVHSIVFEWGNENATHFFTAASWARTCIFARCGLSCCLH